MKPTSAHPGTTSAESPVTDLRLPDFIIVGAMRCGTTSLANFLDRQPYTAIAHGKELHYFDRQYESGLAWYAQHFETLAKPIVGEATPMYLYRADVPGRIAGDLPDVKLIAILRDPVQRAQSHYWYRFARGLESMPLLDAMMAEEDRMADPATENPAFIAYVDRSRYGEQLIRYREVFPPDRLRVLILEEVDRDPVGELTSLLAWLAPSSPGHEVTSAMWPQQDNRHLRFRSQRLRTLVRRTPGALGTVLGAINAVREPYPAPSRAAAAFIRSRLRDDRRVLEDVLGRPVDVWSPL